MIEDALAAMRDAESLFEAGRAELRAPYLNADETSGEGDVDLKPWPENVA